MSSTLEEFEYKSLEAGLPYPENKKDLSTTFKSPTIINHLIYDESGVITYSQTNDYLTYADVYSGISNTYKVSEFVINNAANAVAEAYFYHPVEGYLGTKITIKELKELEKELLK